MSESHHSGTIPTPSFILQNSGQVTFVLFSSYDNSLFYTSNRNGDLKIYDLKLRRSVFSHNPNKESIQSIAELDEANFLTQSRTGLICKWSRNESNWTCNSVYEKESFTFCQIDLGLDKKLLYLPSNEASIVDLIDTNSYKKIKSLRPSKNSKDRGLLMNLKSIDLNYLMAGYESGELALFDLRTNGQAASIDLFTGQPLMCFDYNGDSNFGMCGSSESELKHVALDRKENDSAIDFVSSSSISLVNPGLNCIKIRKTDSKIFSCGSWDSRIRVYGVKKLKLLAVLDFHKEAINTIDFSNSNLMAAGSNDGIISFWNLY